MDDWEIYELGVIPTTTLVITSIRRHHFLVSMHRDAEIFPGLQVLRLTPLKPREGGSGLTGAVDSLKENADDGGALLAGICQARNVDLLRDARANWTCECTSDEGY
jgi:hypothetical protein